MTRFLSFLWRVDSLATASLVALSTVTGVLTALIGVLIGRVVGRTADLDGSVPVGFVWLVAGLVLSLAASSVLPMFAQAMSTRLSDRVVEDTTLRLAVAVSNDVTLATLESPTAMGDVRRIQQRKWEIKGGGRQLVGPAWQLVLAVGSCAVVLATILPWWLPVLLVLAWIAQIAVTTRSIVGEMDLMGRNVEGQKHADYAFTVAMGGAPKEVRIFGLSDFLGARFWSNFTAALEPYWSRRQRRAWLALIPVLARTALTAAAIVVAGVQARAGTITLTGFATALPLIITLGSANDRSFDTIQRGATVLRWLSSLELAANRSTRPLATGHRQADDHATAPAVEFEHVSFTYPGASTPVLRDVSFHLIPGSATALVGDNGAGKSTIVKLICGGYQPTSGRVLVDGINLADSPVDDVAAWQRRIGLVSQWFLRLPLSAADNVEAGAGRLWSTTPDDDHSNDELDQTAAAAGIADLIDSLPNGWATILDRSQEGGIDLSGGEWQRVALARAVRATSSGKAGLMILDEPAAALDVEAELRLVDGYLDLTAGLTSLLISHRFSVVRPAKQILVLSEGQITETGSHDQLMAKHGTYHHMFTVQAAQYVPQES